VSIDEQVLGRPGLTRMVRRWGWVRPLVLRADLAWSRRQQRPFIADHLWCFERV
jgi:hypothetical protein